MHTALFGLFERIGQHFVRKTVHLDVHLSSGNTVFGTGHLEVHVAEVVFIAQDIGQHGVFSGFGVGNQPHGDPGNRFLDLHPGIHQRQRSGTHGSHRGRTVGFQNIGYDANGVRILFAHRYHRLQRAPCQVAMADLATRQAACGTRFAGRERREVIMQHELFGAFHEHVSSSFVPSVTVVSDWVSPRVKTAEPCAAGR